jgi:hypothetical protein
MESLLVVQGTNLWETKWSVPCFVCDESLTWRGLNSNLGHFGYFTFIFVSFGESCLHISWCAGGSCGIMCSDEDRGRSRRPGADDREWSHRSGTRWSGDREVGWRCVVCTVHMETMSSSFLLEPQNQGWRFISGLASQPLGRFSLVWPQNRWWRFSPVWHQNRWRQFLPI